MRFHFRHSSSAIVPTILASAVLGMAAWSPTAFAQQIYRHVDRNGTVTFSDKPPGADERATPTGADARMPAAGTGADMGSGLPYEMRQVVQRFPVVLYTRDDCGPCDTGRALLTSRGVPFVERQIRTPEDSEAFLRLSGQDSLPLMSVGNQQLKGFSDTTWSQYLDAAGYPKSIQLPAAYRNPPAQPLVAKSTAAPSSTAQQASSPSTTPLPPIPPAVTGPTPGNPAGIRF